MSNVLGSIALNLTANTASFTSDLNKAKNEAKNAAREMATEIKESNHSLALFGETFGVTVPRHIRTFVSELPGVSRAMSAAFDGLAILVLIKVIAEAVEKVKQLHEAFNAAAEAPKKIAEGFEKLNQPLEQENRELEVSIAKTETAIAKLEHKPHNGLAEALAEAAAEAGKLSDKLTKAFDESLKLLRSQEQSKFMQVATGSAGTHRVQDVAAYVRDMMSHAPEQGKDSDAYMRSVAQEAWRRLKHVIETPEDDAGRLSIHGIGMQDRSAEIAAAYGLQQQLSEADANVAELAKLGKDNATKNRLEGQKDAANEAEKARRKALEAEKKADDDQRKQWQSQLDALRNNHQLTIAEELRFWLSRQNIRPDNRAFISHETGAVKQRWGAQQAQENTQAEQAESELTRTMSQLFAKQESDREQSIAKQLTDAAELKASQNDLLIAYQLATSQISEQAAKHAAAANKLNVYNVELTQLHSHLANLKAQGADPSKIGMAQNAVNAKQGEIDTFKQGMSLADRQQADMDRAITGVHLFWQSVISDSEQTAQKIDAQMSEMLNGINDNLARAITGQKTNWEQMFRSAGTNLVKTGLEKAEGGILSHFGLGKIGTTGNPMHVVIDAGPPGVQGGIPLVGGQIASSGLTSFLGKIFHFGGFFAEGGDPDPYKTSIVGENGPELFTPGVTGHITSNKDLPGIFGGGQPTISIGSIDARGTNAADVDRRVRQGSLAAYQQAMQDSHTQRMEHNARVPSHNRY